MNSIPLPAGIPTYSGACDYYAWDNSRREIPMLFPDFDLFMIEKGRMGVVWTDGSRTLARPGMFVLIPPLAPVRIEKQAAPLEYWFCHFNFRVLPGAIHNRLQPDYLGPAREVSVPSVFTPKQAPGVYAAYRHLAGLTFKEGKAPWRFESALLLLVGELKHFGWRIGTQAAAVRGSPQQGRPRHTPSPGGFQDRRLASVLGRIRARPEARWNVAELAASVGISADRLNTLAQRITRKSIKQHVIEARFQLAFELLRPSGDERASIKEVSARCGFSSQHFFCRLFKRRFNLTPSEFRDSTVMT